MPYIKREARPYIDEWVKSMPPMVSTGHMNYTITRILMSFIGGTHSYSQFNDVIGLLECIKQEFYRRMVATYEEDKIIENGDVFL